METTLYHIVQPEWWANFGNKDYYESETLSEEKFIHLSTLEQVNGTLTNFFKGSERILLLQINVEKLTSELIFEDLYNHGSMYPHLYGRLNKDAVVEVRELLAGDDGILKI